jgi:hypothetical protein
VIDSNPIAEMLYGSDIEKSERDAPLPPTEDRHADALYDKQDQQVSDTRDQDGYDKVHGSTERVIETALLDRAGVMPAEAKQVAQSWSPLFRELGIEPAVADGLTSVALGNLLGGVEWTPEWRVDAINALRAEYGDQVEQVTKDAQAFVARHPKLAEFLYETGLGDNSRFVLAAAARGRAMRLAGKLK